MQEYFKIVERAIPSTAKIIQRRIELHIKRKDFAKLCNISYSHYYKIETGRVKQITPIIMEKILKNL